MDRRFAAILEEDFAIPAATVLDALKGEPQKQAIRICTWASRQEDPARALPCWAAKHRRGRHRRCAGAGTGRPSRNCRRHDPGRDIAAPREVPQERPRQRRDDSLRGLADVDVLDRMAERLGVS